uniref:Uncharacterized protein n=1 Tax=Phasianus colchicus TaxID=9054 RepID=A0A669PCE8_PHACC
MLKVWQKFHFPHHLTGSSHRFSQLGGKHQAQILTDIKGRFQSLDVGCDPRDAVDAHLLHPTALYLLHALAKDINHIRGVEAVLFAVLTPFIEMTVRCQSLSCSVCGSS